ncbi:hypothetical protein [Sporosarcina highlanderae]|uniref:Uncharacterized protein n=1 Tax=Sporosarcina highlanderae TaxID=3035916 RepID=A0ABT8JLF2_9BACL|nr:hypothetical protein [Sporosarcina highlanderae]MDN4605975.1 hypothetical protein [Sporosarcina highlanderae]
MDEWGFVHVQGEALPSTEGMLAAMAKMIRPTKNAAGAAPAVNLKEGESQNGTNG